ncbi:MAG: hypothetical protein SVN78_08845 [Deferribacterota bacterium]|nr:hypothetical protein [Deferribacterota bacterium]
MLIYRKIIIFLFIVFISILINKQLLAYGEYNTPDSWGMHTTPGGFKNNIEGIRIGNDAIMDLNLTTRYRMRSTENLDDHDFYQYLRGGIRNIKLGQGTVESSLFIRFADDIDGTDKDHFYGDSLDLGLDGDEWDTRFYHGDITFNNVVPNTKLVVGRQYVSHIETLQIDGADLSYKINDMLTVFGFSGAAVNYYDDWDDDWIHGGGVELKPFDGTKVRFEYIRADVEGFNDDIFHLRLDQQLLYGNAYAQLGILDSAESLEIGGTFRHPSWGTILNIKYEGVYDEIGEDNSYIENPLTYALLPYGKYNLINLSAYQPFMEHFVLGAGVEHRAVDGTEDFFNRNYTKFFTSFDIIGIPTEGTYLSLFAEKWDTGDNKDASEEEKIHAGAELSQIISRTLELYCGTRYDRYEYDFVEFNYNNLEVVRPRKKESIRTYYIGGVWEPTKRVSLSVDCNIENSDVFDDEDYENNYTVEAWLNIAL